MATQYNLTHSCGHKEIRYVSGPNKATRDRWADLWSQKECSECYRAKQNEQSAKESETEGFPKLSGTEKQVAWANSIRLGYVVTLNKAIRETAGIIDESHIKTMKSKLEKALKETDAKTFIDERFIIERDKGHLLDAIRFANEVAKGEGNE